MFDAVHSWAPFVLNVNPLIVQLGSLRFWYYGLAYSVGLLSVFLWLMIRRARIGLRPDLVWSLALFFTALSLIGGRIYELTVHEPGVFRADPFEILKFWHGGIALPGVLLGAAIGTAAFCLIYKQNFLRIADQLTIPAALLLMFAAAGNHITGEAYGSPTTIWWAVKFPYTEGFRHPIAMYDFTRSAFLMFLLVIVKTRAFPTPGKLLGHFIFWYGISSIPLDYVRVHGSGPFGIGNVYYYHLLITAVGLLLIMRSARRHSKFDIDTLRFAPAAILSRIPSYMSTHNYGKAIIFVLLLLLSLTMPGSWSDDVLRPVPNRSAVQQAHRR